MTRNPHRIADLHCHFPMHVNASGSPDRVEDRKLCSRRRWWWLDRPRVVAFDLFARALNFSSCSATWRVDLEGLDEAGSGLVLSVLHDPVYEWVVVPLVQRPRRHAFEALVCQLDCVEQELARVDSGNARHRVATTPEELDDALNSRRMAFVHCVEGGYHLGRNRCEIVENVETLAERGVAYVTLAHLLYRGYATCAGAFPFMQDPVFDLIVPQRGKGLSDLGQTAVREMYRHKIAVDVSHMDQDALDDTFDLLDELDRPPRSDRGAKRRDPREHPVIASHAGHRFGKQAYMLSECTTKKIKRRGGVIGLILARHQLHDGLCERDFEALRCHIGRICEITGSHGYTCIGSDLDGFIKPISGIDAANDLADLATWLRREYSEADADAILFGNAEQVVRNILQRP